MISINKLCSKYIFVLGIVALVHTFCSCSNPNNISNIDISNVVEEAFITEDGYSDDLSKHMSEEVFKEVNLFNTYAQTVVSTFTYISQLILTGI